MPILGALSDSFGAKPRGSYVEIKKANNGFIVDAMSADGHKSFVAKTKKEANNIAKKQISNGITSVSRVTPILPSSKS